MRYQILVPPNPTDPRELEIKSSDMLNDVLPIVMDCETEAQAVRYVRARYHDAVAMPFPVKVGSGEIVLLGIVPDPQRVIDPHGEIPFVMFVRMVAQHDADRHRLKKGPAGGFDRTLWKVPVINPELASTYQVDLRATDLEVPTFTGAHVGSHEGRLVIYVNVGGIEMSIRFEDPRVQLIVSSGSASTVDSDGRDASDLNRVGM